MIIIIFKNSETPNSIIYANLKCSFQINVWHSVSSEVYSRSPEVYSVLVTALTNENWLNQFTRRKFITSTLGFGCFLIIYFKEYFQDLNASVSLNIKAIKKKVDKISDKSTK